MFLAIHTGKVSLPRFDLCNRYIIYINCTYYLDSSCYFIYNLKIFNNAFFRSRPAASLTWRINDHEVRIALAIDTCNQNIC